MQGYDLIMLIVIGMATIFGAIKGFAWQVASLASVVVSYIVAYRFRFDVAAMISAKPPWNQFLAMLILYVSTSFVIWVGFRLLSGFIDRVRLKEFDRHLGAGFGLLKGMVYCLLITMFAMSLLGPSQQAAICQSRSGYYISVALDRGVGILPKEIHDVVEPYLSGLDEKLNNHEAHEGLHTQEAEAGTEFIPNLQGLPGNFSQGFENASRNVQNAITDQFQQQLGNQIRDAFPGYATGAGQPSGLPPNANLSQLDANSGAQPNILPPALGPNGTPANGLPNASFPNGGGVLPTTGTPSPQYGQPPVGLRPAHTSSGSSQSGAGYVLPR